METQVLEMPFIHYEKQGTIEVCYSENRSPIESGFEIVKDLVPDLNICIGYPTIHAYLKSFQGKGFLKYIGWIQIIKFEFYNSVDSIYPDNVITQVDVANSMKESGIPFYSFGFPADLYDAPCNNYTDCLKLKWSAETFLVSMPRFSNEESISYLAGFKWGFEDIHTENTQQIQILSIQEINSKYWDNHISMLKHDFPKWNFAK